MMNRLSRPFPPDVLEAWQAGTDDFNQGKYRDAHEKWERHWRRLAPPDRDYVQALIQAAAVFYHLENGRAGPARVLSRKALDKLAKIAEEWPDFARARPRLEIGRIGCALEKILESDGTDWRSVADSLRARILL